MGELTALEQSAVAGGAQESIQNLDGNAMTTGGGGKAFFGNIVDHKFVATKLRLGAKHSKLRNAEFRITDPEKKNSIRAFIADPERVSSHTLTLKTQHTVNKKNVVFVGSQQVHVRFPLAMVVPGGTATLDTALNMIPRYATHWQGIQPQFRHVEPAAMAVTDSLPSKLKPSHYDDVIRALTAAANAATAGVVALSVGHGSDGTTSVTSLGAVPFINLVPEDNKFGVTKVQFRLRINEDDLTPFDEPPKPGAIKFIPSNDTLVRLDALDRIADALKQTPIRRLLLHTCNTGRAPQFVQLLANRLRVPVMAQTDFVIFEPAASYYEKDKQAKLPRDEQFWPIHRVGAVKRPRPTPPPRLGPP